MRVPYSEKVTFMGLYPHNGDKWQFWWLYQTDPIAGHPWETYGPTLFFFSYCQKRPILAPKIGPKWSKTAQIAVLLLY